MFEAAIIFSNTTITFWDLMLLFFIWIPLVLVWLFAFFDIFRRDDLTGLGKAVWVLAIVIFPWIGVLFYLVTRPRQAGPVHDPNARPPAGGSGRQ
ncbi:MAG TPA: PLDc N-terminal domain-containing protein [Chloroflexota bacterium]